MILIISTCKEKLHENEFVKPVEEIVGSGFVTKHYLELSEDDLKVAEKIIICGTSLSDNEYLENLNKFEWLENFEKPILGICAGMQIIGLAFGGILKEKKEIGYYKERFILDFLGLFGEEEVYHLHKNYVEFKEEFVNHSNSKIPQAVKHKNKEIYASLFHPEVRNKNVIENFLKNK